MIDGATPGQDVEDFVRSVHRSVTDVLGAALALSPPAGADGEPVVDDPTHEERTLLEERLRAILAPVDRYFEIWDSDATDPRAVVEGSLADSLADVYHDVRHGLALGAAVAEAEAVFAWMDSFWRHWGRHAADGVRVLQLLRKREGWVF